MTFAVDSWFAHGFWEEHKSLPVIHMDWANFLFVYQTYRLVMITEEVDKNIKAHLIQLRKVINTK